MKALVLRVSFSYRNTDGVSFHWAASNTSSCHNTVIVTVVSVDFMGISVVIHLKEKKSTLNPGVFYFLKHCKICYLIC